MRNSGVLDWLKPLKKVAMAFDTIATYLALAILFARDLRFPLDLSKRLILAQEKRMTKWAYPQCLIILYANIDKINRYLICFFIICQ